MSLPRIDQDHPLVDGNKRIAVTTTATFVLINGYELTVTNEAIRDYALRVARTKGEYPLGAIRRWLQRGTELMPDPELAKRRDTNLSFHNMGIFARESLW